MALLTPRRSRGVDLRRRSGGGTAVEQWDHGGAANSGEPYNAQQREETRGKQARRVHYPHVKLLWCGVGAERRRRGGILARSWRRRGGSTELLRGNSPARRAEVVEGGLGGVLGSTAELLRQLRWRRRGGAAGAWRRRVLCSAEQGEAGGARVLWRLWRRGRGPGRPQGAFIRRRPT